MLLERPVAPRATIPTDLDPVPALADARRLAAIPEPSAETRAALDHLAALTAHTLGGEESYVALVLPDRQQAVGRYGPHETWPTMTGYCAYTLAVGEPLLLGDLLEDPIAAENEAVALGVRSYAGTPVRVNGERVGTLCVLSQRVRAWTIGDAERLVHLAQIADYLLES